MNVLQGEEKKFINHEIKKYFQSVKNKNEFNRAAGYIIGPDGHRYRSLVSLAIYESLGGKRKEYVESLIGIECIHAASLIFDDLPAFDNSFMRKGKASAHVKFSESTAILAGIYLMNTGQYLLLNNIQRHRKDPALNSEIQDLVYKTVNTMLCGEEIDLRKNKSKKDLHRSMILKSELFRFACILPGFMFGKKHKSVIRVLEKLATQFAETYQLFDDLRDISRPQLTGKPIGLDVEKNTSLYRYGEHTVKKMIGKQIEKMIKTVKKLNKSERLQSLIHSIFSVPS